jgi:hypothetical protein
LRIIQQAQKRLLEGLVLLGLLDLVFTFVSILHRAIMPDGSSAERPSAVVAAKNGEVAGLVPLFVSEDPQCRRQKSVRVAIRATLVFFGWLIFRSSQNTGSADGCLVIALR